jgi:hypothetical protein
MNLENTFIVIFMCTAATHLLFLMDVLSLFAAINVFTSKKKRKEKCHAHLCRRREPARAQIMLRRLSTHMHYSAVKINGKASSQQWRFSVSCWKNRCTLIKRKQRRRRYR